MEYRAKEASKEECRAYENETSRYPPDYLLFLDGMTTRDVKFRRRRGYFRRGQEPIMKQFLGFGDQTGTSLIAACNVRKVLVNGCLLTFEDNTREKFEHNIENVLGPDIYVLTQVRTQ